MNNDSQGVKLPKKDDNNEDHSVPPNYVKYVSYVFQPMMIFLRILGLGRRIDKIMESKKKHTWALPVMRKMIDDVSCYKYSNSTSREQPRNLRDIDETHPGLLKEIPPRKYEDESERVPIRRSKYEDYEWERVPIHRSKYEDEDEWERVLISRGSKYEGEWIRVPRKRGKELIKSEKGTALLIAAKNGIMEIVETILKKFPVALQDMNRERKNIVLLAVENRQIQIYELLLTKKTKEESEFRHVDHEGNSALHLAAKCGEHQPWLIPGGALQMQWEWKWYKYVKNSMQPIFFVRYNNHGKTPKEIFRETHKELVSDGRNWLTKTSEACSVVAALIATVAFGASVTVPVGFNEANGKRNLEDNAVYDMFAFSSLLALCFSVTALIFFLTILTSRYQEKDFGKSLPRKLLIGLTSLFISIASVLISFCSGHSFVVKERLRFATYPIYLATCLPMFYFALEHFPLYFDLIKAICKTVPQRSY